MNRPGRVGRARRGSARAVGLLAASMAVLLTAGCGLFGGGDSGSDASSDTSAKNAGPLEKTTINLGVLPAIDSSGVQIAIERGLFEAEGLTVKTQELQSGAASIEKLNNGELDMSFGNWVSFIQAQQKKLIDLRFIGEAYLSTPNSNFVLVTTPDSGISSVKDLEGQPIAVNAPHNINELLIRAVFEANDVKFDANMLTPMAFPAMAQALQTGQVKAASFIDPWTVDAQKNVGGKVVVDLTGQGPTKDFPVSGYATTAKFAKDNPNTVAAFQRALLKGQQLAGDRKNVEEALPKFAKMPAETAAIVRYGTFPTSIDAKRIQRVSDLLTTYQMMDKLDVTKLVIPFPTSSS